MKCERLLTEAAWGLAVLLAVACTAIPSSLLSRATATPATEISYCGSVPTSFCLVSLGMDNNNRMLLNFFVPASMEQDIHLKIVSDKDVFDYQCRSIEGFANTVYCVGAPLPLGAFVTVQAYSNNGNVLLASGTLAVNGIALPTPEITIPTAATNEEATLAVPPVPNIPTSTPVSTITATPPATYSPYSNP